MPVCFPLRDDGGGSITGPGERGVTPHHPASGPRLSPEQTEGPYHIDLDEVRGDITEDREGAPLRLRIEVLDADLCAPLQDAAVEVWHADAAGAYSGVGSFAGETFLRGTRMTGADGVAEFRTIYPGWYPGRAVHVHGVRRA